MEFEGIVTELGMDTIDVTTPADKWRTYVAGRRWFEVQWDGDRRQFYSEELPPLGANVSIKVEVRR